MTRPLKVLALCAFALALLLPPTASAAHSLRFTIGKFFPSPGVSEYHEGPCGAAVDSHGNLYVSDYYHNKINVFSSAGAFVTQIPGVNSLNGPCDLAVDPAGVVYANLFHGGVVVLEPSSFPPSGSTTYANSGEVLTARATGIALDPASGNLLLGERSFVAEYELPLEAAEAPLRTIGAGSLTDGYGLAVSGFAGTEGYVYVADAASSSVKVYDPATSLTTPVAEIDGEGTPLGRFNELTDAALAVDDSNGHLFVADNIDGQLFEHPRAAVQELDAVGSFLEQLKPTVIDGEPVGLAVDNTGAATQGYVYITSGNTEKASVLAFGPAIPAPEPLVAPRGGAGEPATVTSPSAPGASSPGAEAEGATASEVSQKGRLRVSVAGKLSPSRLPRRGSAPVLVSVSGRVITTDGSAPPRLQRLTIEINRHGRLDLVGLPLCPLSRIQPASTARALAACRQALVGQGRFSAETSLSGEPYPTQGRLLLFNARRQGRPVLYGHVYAKRPFTSSRIIPFALRPAGGNTYGTELSANLAASLGARSSLIGLEMNLSRRYRHNGRRHSFLSAGCPAPKGFSTAAFPLARASFSFADGRKLSATLVRSCRAR